MDFAWIFLIIAAVIYLILRYYPRRKKPLEPESVGMETLGFTLVEYPEAVLKKKVIQLHTKYENQELVLHDVFKKEGDKEWLFLFDIMDHANKDPYLLAQDVVAIISQELNTPRLTMISRPNASGGSVGGVFNRFVSRLANWENNIQGLKQLSFTDQPNFENRFFVFSPTEEPAKTFLTPERLETLSNLDTPYAIDMGMDILTLHQNMPDRKINRKDRIEQTLNDTQAVAEILKTGTSTG